MRIVWKMWMTNKMRQITEIDTNDKRKGGKVTNMTQCEHDNVALRAILFIHVRFGSVFLYTIQAFREKGSQIPRKKIIIKTGAFCSQLAIWRCNELIKIKPRKWEWRQSSREHTQHTTPNGDDNVFPVSVFRRSWRSAVPSLSLARCLQCATFIRFLLHFVQKRVLMFTHIAAAGNVLTEWAKRER